MLFALGESWLGFRREGRVPEGRICPVDHPATSTTTAPPKHEHTPPSRSWSCIAHFHPENTNHITLHHCFPLIRHPTSDLVVVSLIRKSYLPTLLPHPTKKEKTGISTSPSSRDKPYLIISYIFIMFWWRYTMKIIGATKVRSKHGWLQHILDFVMWLWYHIMLHFELSCLIMLYFWHMY